ncbi:MAG: hypothetical protein Q7T76_04275 [Ferruginibacter sp.]|nr:hypothetical protein [Ferruginibacter sp.]
MLKLKIIFFFLVNAVCLPNLLAQTDMDAIMMGKNRFCVGPMYSYTSWKDYWEGSFKRNNLNLGTVSTQTISVMGNYGISSKLNLLFNVPYVKTKATAGTMSGLKGMQDLSLFVKWMPIEKEMLGGVFSLYGIGGVSVPLTNYVADYLPLSIGIRSKTASARLMADYQTGSLFVTASGTYVVRDNIEIDRTSYYTNEMHLTNEVSIPNGGNLNIRAGFRNERLIAEAILNKWKTFGGFDISKNNMPFPSNRMDATMLGLNVKYVVKPGTNEVSLVAGGNTTIAGRNVGKSSTVYGSVFYVFDFSRKSKSIKTPEKTN